MKLRFTEPVSAPAWYIPAGAEIDVEKLTPEHERWIANGTCVVVRDPDAGLETPERTEDLEHAGRPFVPRRCPTGLVVCLGGGPSLTQSDVDACRGRATVIAVNDAYRLAPWAEVLYAADAKWWKWHAAQLHEFAGLKFSIKGVDASYPLDLGIQVLENTGITGLELKPTGLRTGRNSGYQAINVAVHLGATRILLLGYDMQLGPKGQAHWFGDHPDKIKPPVASFLPEFKHLVKPLQARGIPVINCSRQTALTTFRRMTLEEALTAREVAA